MLFGQLFQYIALNRSMTPSEFKYECLARFKLYVVCEVSLCAVNHVVCRLMVAYYLCVVCHIKCVVLFLSVNYREYGASFVLACHHVNAVYGDELCLRAFCYDIVALTPVQKPAHEAEHGVFS